MHCCIYLNSIIALICYRNERTLWLHTVLRYLAASSEYQRNRQPSANLSTNQWVGHKITPPPPPETTHPSLPPTRKGGYIFGTFSVALRSIDRLFPVVFWRCSCSSSLFWLARLTLWVR